MNYRETYAFADRLEHREFFPLPKHVLGTPYADSKETLISQPYFTDDYVGVGPYKLQAWEHGAYMISCGARSVPSGIRHSKGIGGGPST